MSAADHIWALVSGLPPGKREQRLLFMLQAFADLSEDFLPRPPVFVLGGWIASAERWADFTTAWQTVLDLDPKLTVFKYRDFLRRDGEFRLWNEAAWSAREKRADLFRQVIEDHDLAHFAIVFRTDSYKRAFGRWGPGKQQNPYFFASGEITAAVAHNVEKLGFGRQPIDFYFDRQLHEENTIYDGWADKMKSPLKDIVRNPPAFRDDVEVRPLQAADMLVTLLRMTQTSKEQGTDAPPWGFQKKLKGLLVTINEQQMHAVEQRRARNFRFRHGVSPYDFAKAKKTSSRKRPS